MWKVNGTNLSGDKKSIMCKNKHIASSLRFKHDQRKGFPPPMHPAYGECVRVQATVVHRRPWVCARGPKGSRPRAKRSIAHVSQGSSTQPQQGGLS